VAKAYLFSFKFDSIIQNIQEGEGSALVDHDSVEILVHTYKFLENGTLQPNDVKKNSLFFLFKIKISFFHRLEKINQ
jgi:hypothetical protein